MPICLEYTQQQRPVLYLQYNCPVKLSELREFQYISDKTVVNYDSLCAIPTHALRLLNLDVIDLSPSFLP